MRMARSLSRSSKSDSLSETHGDPNTQPGRWPLGKFSLRADLSLRTTRFLMQCWPHAFISYPQSLGKTLMLGKVEGRKTRGWQDEMVGWRHRLDGHEFEQAPGDSEGQGSLVCCSPWGCKEPDTTLATEQQQIIPNFCPICIPDWVQNAQFRSKFHLSCLGQTSSHEFIRGQNHVIYRHGNRRDSPVCWGAVSSERGTTVT